MIAPTEEVAEPDFRDERSIDIAAPPDRVWPWLTQMGFGRAGWTHCGRVSADRGRDRPHRRPLGRLFARYLLGPGDAFMVRKQLRGIRARSEGDAPW